MKYTRLTQAERWQIEALRTSGKSYEAIGAQLGRCARTISREICRNSTVHGYKPEQADRMARNRHNTKNYKRYKLRGEVLSLVTAKLQEYWSPKQISGWLQEVHKVRLSHETIYRWIWKQKRRGLDFHKYLRQGGKKRHRRAKVNGTRFKIPGRVDIAERPKIVEKKQRIGDFEGDTIVGKGRKGAIVSMVDRKSKYTTLALVPDGKSETVINAIQISLTPHAHKVKTMTFDNGTEFTNHQDLHEPLQAKTYFATPYHSWERGLNEHTNGLVRQFFPKGTDFTTLTDAAVARVQDLLNNRPRESLNFKSPHQVFFARP
jgi:IS30 family transposase